MALDHFGVDWPWPPGQRRAGSRQGTGTAAVWSHCHRLNIFNIDQHRSSISEVFNLRILKPYDMVWSLAQPVSCEQHFAVPMTRRCIAMHSFATFSSRPISRTSEWRQQIGRSSGRRSGQFYCRFLSHGFKSETVKKFKTLGEFVLLLIGCFWDIKVLRKTKVLGLVVLVLWTQIQRWLPFVRL